MAAEYVPDAGDLVWIQFDPRVGHEQGGHRPALVISPATYNRRAGLAVMVPVTTQRKGYPFEVALPEQSAIAGVVLADHVHSFDWRLRGAKRAGKVPRTVMQEVREGIAALLRIE